MLQLEKKLQLKKRNFQKVLLAAASLESGAQGAGRVTKEESVLAKLNGNESAVDRQSSALIGRWFEAYSVELRRYLVRNRCGADEIDDLLHDVFVVALKGYSRYRENGHAKAYLYRIARNLILASRRKKRPESNLEPEAIADCQTQSKQQQLENRESAGTIRQGFQQISQVQRMVIQLRLDKDLPFKEIAKITDLSLNTVMSHYHRGIAKLRKMSGRKKT